MMVLMFLALLNQRSVFYWLWNIRLVQTLLLH